MKPVWEKKFGKLEEGDTYTRKMQMESRILVNKMIKEIKKNYPDYSIYYDAEYKIVIDE